MKSHIKPIVGLVVSLLWNSGVTWANATLNQTDDTTTILSGASLPFQIKIEQANFKLPVGYHSGAVGVYQGQWVLIAGRTNGLHGFGADPFPPDKQNSVIYVVNPQTGVTVSRALTDPGSGLTQHQIDTLSVTSPQSYQSGSTLYMTGGYNFDSTTASYLTQPYLTAINLPGLIQWVNNPGNGNLSVAKNIRQISNPMFQITGGQMFKSGKLSLLIFGQNFTGAYTPASNGAYSQQVRVFEIQDSPGQFNVRYLPSLPQVPDPNYRRRDLNIVPSLLNVNHQLQYGYVAYSGVFTIPGGVWTVPVVIDENGQAAMADPNAPATFKQGMNNYVSAIAALYSRKYSSMFNVFLGGLSYGYYSNGVFTTDAEVPFINQVTTVQMDKNNRFSQYLMDGQYPVIPSTGVNPGNTLLFGAASDFINNNIQQYPNGVLSLDHIRKPTVIGYIVGGIKSTLPNTNTMADSSASEYVFKVTLIPKA